MAILLLSFFGSARPLLAAVALFLPAGGPDALPAAAPTSAVVSAPATAPAIAPPSATVPAPAPVSAPPSAPASAAPACDATAWPAPPSNAPAPVAVRVAAHEVSAAGAVLSPWFELLLPPAAKGSRPAPADGHACLWIDPAGAYTNQSGVSVAGELPGSAPPRPPQASRFHRLKVSGCAGATTLEACVRLENVPELDDAPGRIPALLRLPGRDEPLALVLHRTPAYGWLFLCMLVGLVASFFVTLWGPKFTGLRDRRRRLRQLETRRAASEEDFMPLLNRVDALLDMCRARLDGGAVIIGVLVFDETLLDDRLLEAAQLLTLSEEKTRCWQTSQVADLPPSVETEVADLLRRFDAEVFLLGLPVRTDPANPKAWYPEPLRDALARVKSAGPAFHANLGAALTQALATAGQTTGPTPGATTGPTPGQTTGSTPGPPPLPAGASAKTTALFADVCALRDAQLAALAPYRGNSGSELEALAPRTVRALDARLNVWRAAGHYLDTLRAGAEPDDAQIRKLRDGLADFAARDLSGPVCGRPDLPALRVLQWSVDNRRTLTDLLGVLQGTLAAEPTPPMAGAPIAITSPTATPATTAPGADSGRRVLTCVCAKSWRTYDPVTLELRLNHPLSGTYVWRQNIRVTWRVETVANGAAGSLRFAGAVSREVDGATLHECASGRATAYANEKGCFKVRPVSVSFRDPLTGRFDPPVALADGVVGDRRVAVEHNPEARWFAGVGAAQLIRFLCTGALSVITGLVFVDGLFSNAQGWAVYAQAFAWAFGIDLATVALRGGWTKLQTVLAGLPAFQRAEQRGDLPPAPLR